MNKNILDYLKGQRAGVLSLEMLDGSPHAATVHFAHTDVPPFNLYFETYRDSRKAETLFAREVTRAALVIGVSEDDMKTLQLNGEVRLLKAKEKKAFDLIYLGKFPEKKEKSKDPKFVIFKFVPKWWRFTDWTTPKGKMILTSEKTK